MYYSYCSCPVGIVEISASDTGLESIDFVKEADQNKQSNHITESVKIQIDQYFAGTRMAFDIDFRNEILSQLEYQTTTEKTMKNINSDKKIPLNQILFGAPGTGKSFKLNDEQKDLIHI